LINKVLIKGIYVPCVDFGRNFQGHLWDLGSELLVVYVGESVSVRLWCFWVRKDRFPIKYPTYTDREDQNHKIDDISPFTRRKKTS
jgi:hypothetical protein